MSPTEVPNPRLFHECFEERVVRDPDSIALIEETRTTTYSELHRRSMAVSEALRRAGAGEGALVGLHVERSAEWVAAMLGILRNGSVVVPIPPAYPRERIRQILERADIDLVLDHPEWPLPDDLPASTLSLASMSPASIPSGSGSMTSMPPASTHPVGSAERPASVEPSSPAFVLCSSGSTGHPKLIGRSHRSFFHRLEWTWSRHPFAPGEVGCQKAHMTTTHSLYELFEPLLKGVPVVIVPDEKVRDLEAFWETVRARDVTRLLIVPSMLQATLAVPDLGLPPLEVVVLMGEYVPPDLAAQALDRFPPDTALYSIYGSTESSSILCCDLRESYRAGEEVPLGEPLSADTRVAVLDGDGAPVSPDTVGRLYVAGPPLFDEYVGDPSLTAEAFATIDGARFYDTRDDVRRTSDGRLLFVGRVDHTVKIRGYRVDLPEVESAMLVHQGVTQGAVVVSEARSSAATLAGFYTPGSVEPSEVYEAMRTRLPDYMVPASLAALDELPLTVSGKVDRARLLKMYEEQPGGSEFVATSPMEERVADAWEEVLGHRRFRSDSSFFEAGGSSLTVFRLTHHLREALGLDRAELTEGAVYRHPTVAGLAARIEAVRTGEAGPSSRSAQPLLVPLRSGPSGPGPLFLVASAGGTLGAYERLVGKLRAEREIIGIRDPMVSGERDIQEGFDRWVDRYVDALTARQPTGPYHICAYSSAGAFGYEIGRRLVESGEEVALLALVDPLGLGFRRPGFGHWALRATWMGARKRALVRLAGTLRVPFARLVSRLLPSPTAGAAAHQADGQPAHQTDERATEGAEDQAAGIETEGLAREIRRNKGHLMNVAALMELNSGLPFSLREADFEGVDEDGYLDVLKDRVAAVSPDVDPEMIERVTVQYELQVRAQHRYRLRRYRGPRLLLVEPATAYAGLLASLLRPHVDHLVTRILPLGEPTSEVRDLTKRFGSLEGHFRSMRDEVFVSALAEELDRCLDEARPG